MSDDSRQTRSSKIAFDRDRCIDLHQEVYTGKEISSKSIEVGHSQRNGNISNTMNRKTRLKVDRPWKLTLEIKRLIVLLGKGDFQQENW